MVAVFAAKDRVIERGRQRAERIEAEARERARVDYEEAAAAIIVGAEKEARRIIEGALVTRERAQYESILEKRGPRPTARLWRRERGPDRIVSQALAGVTDSEGRAR